MTFEVEKAVVGREPFTVIEIDLDFCTLQYGVPPCMASADSNGGQKCFNTYASCQDRENYTPAPRTYRFCENVARLPKSLDAFPYLAAVSITPTKLAIGSGLGERARVSVTLVDAPHHDRGVDPYVAERDYNPMEQGSFFGKFVSRNRYYLGRPMRVLTGYLTEDEKGAPVYDAANFQTRLYFIEKMDPPDSAGRVVITAKDILKLVDDDRAQAPRPAKGRLAAPISAGDTAATLDPVGIGDLAYSAAGVLRVNDELMDFTRAGDALTLNRGQYNSTAKAHALDDAVQECYVVGNSSSGGEPIEDIIYDLLVNYGNVSPAYIDTAAWAAESETYLTRLYSTIVAAPVGVNQLLNELCEQGPAYIWWDEVAGQIRFRALRPAASAAVELNDDEHFLAGSLRALDKQDARVSQVWMYFGQRTYTDAIDNPSNFKQVLIAIGDGEDVNKHGQPKVKKVFCRWIPEFGRTFAEQVADLILQRYNETPKQISFALDPKDSSLSLGDLFRGRTRLAQDDDGSKREIVYQVIEAREVYGQGRYVFEALEERYTPSATESQRIIIVGVDTHDFNLRNVHDSLYEAPSEAVEVLCVVEAGIVVGSTSVTTPAFEVGDWPDGSLITVKLRGRIQGKGGDGATITFGVGTRHNGQDGGDALYTRFPIILDGSQGTPEIFSGGGGGGEGSPFNGFPGGPGGGGAGEVPGYRQGSPAAPATYATRDAGAPGALGFNLNNHGGDGGGPGEDGLQGEGTNVGYGGIKGNAIDGVSYITFTDSATDIRGPEIN